MQNRKRTHMAFRPCVSQSTLEDRLVLNGGASAAMGAIGSQAAAILPPAHAATLVLPMTSASLISSSGHTSGAGSLTGNNVSNLGSSQFAGSPGNDAASGGSTGIGGTTTTGTGGGTLTGTTSTSSVGTGSSANTGTGLGITGIDSGLLTSNLQGTQQLAIPSYTAIQTVSGLSYDPAYALNIPGTTPLNLPTGPLPGIAGTPHSAIGYWGYSNGFDDGFYDFPSEVTRSAAVFNNSYQGYYQLTDPFIASFQYSMTTQGCGASSGPAVSSTEAGGAGGGGTGTRGMGPPSLAPSEVAARAGSAKLFSVPVLVAQAWEAWATLMRMRRVGLPPPKVRAQAVLPPRPRAPEHPLPETRPPAFPAPILRFQELPAKAPQVPRTRAVPLRAVLAMWDQTRATQALAARAPAVPPPEDPTPAARPLVRRAQAAPVMWVQAPAVPAAAARAVVVVPAPAARAVAATSLLHQEPAAPDPNRLRSTTPPPIPSPFAASWGFSFPCRQTAPVTVR